MLFWSIAIPALAAPGDYAAGSRTWNGLADLVELAREAGARVDVPLRLDLSTLTPQDGVLVIYPNAAPPSGDLSAFMADGGRLAIADDFGNGRALLSAFHIERFAPAGGETPRRLRDNRHLLIAKPVARHTLTEGVVALATNHPQALRHRELSAIFTLAESGEPVLLTGTVGQGRLVALSDPSVLINNMLELDGNRTFATNLTRYLARDGRLLIATPSTTFTGRYGSITSTDRLAALRASLARAAKVALPPLAIQLTAAVFAILLIAAALSSLPRRASYARAMALPEIEIDAGFAGQVGYYADPSRDLAAPLRIYRDEWERRLLRAGAANTASLARARALLAELNALLPVNSGESPRISTQRFHAIVSSGERILADLESSNA